MAKSQPRILTKEYWRSFALTAEELNYLHQLILPPLPPDPVDCCVPDPEHEESREELQAKYDRLHG